MTSLRFDDVACLRGGRLLFEGVSFVLSAGQGGIVTGPNGTGKSSLLRLAAGLLEAAHGRVDRDGAVALADESLALERDLALEKALAFWAGLDGRRSALPDAMAAMGLTHLSPVPVRMLSTGQRKRAMIARVVAGGAAIWLLDEPANGLDAEAIERLQNACAAHQAAGGIVLAATHQALDLQNAISIPLAPFAASGTGPFLDLDGEGH